MERERSFHISPDELTTIDEVLSTSLIAGMITKKQHRLPYDLFRFSESLQGNTGRLELAELGVHVRCLVSVHVSWRHAVHTDAMLCPFGSKTFCDGGDGCFRGVVEDLGEGNVLGRLINDLRGHASVDDDASFALTRYPKFCSSIAGIKDTQYVNTINVIKVLLGELCGRLHNGNTSIGDEASNWSKLIVDPFEDLSDEVRLGDITLVGFDFHTKLLRNLLSNFVCILRAPIDNGNVGTSGRYTSAKFVTNPTVSSRNDDRLAFEINREHHDENVFLAGLRAGLGWGR